MSVMTIAPGTATLVRAEGQRGTCNCCGQRIARTYVIALTDGAELRVGRKCAATATGYKVNVIELRARQAARAVVLAERRALVSDEYPALTSEQIADVIASDWAWRPGSEAWRGFAHRHSKTSK